jgi:hypothetical protein
MQTEIERLERVAKARVRSRERNRAAGIPDMEVGDRHDPCEWFAQIGFFAVLDKIGRNEPVDDWSDEGGTEQDREDYLAARKQDQQRVADWLREASISPIPNRNGCDIGDMRCMWVDRVPALKTWAGQQTLAKLAKKRQAALPKEVADVVAVEAPVKGSSGLDKRAATTALEDGFSIGAEGMARMTRVGTELLAIIGLEFIPVTVYPDGAIEYAAGESRYVFRVEDRGEYYGRWGTAERVRN